MLPSGKRIDILCKDGDGRLVVVELKKYATRDVLNQLLGYMAELQSKSPNGIRGIVLGSTVDEDLEAKVGVLGGAGITIKYYKLDVNIVPKEES